MNRTPRVLWTSLLVLALLGVASTARAQSEESDAAKLEFFEKRIRPLLAANCFACHSADTNSQGGLRVDDRNGLLTGGSRGAAIVPGKSPESLLIRAVTRTDAELKMPPKKELAPEDVADLARWIDSGAVWPQEELPSDIGQDQDQYDRLRKEHWAWQPIGEVRVPRVQDARWPLSDVDAFVLARLEEKGLRPVEEADRLTLIRRLTFDLTGLPPTPAQIDAFVGDASPLAWETVVDRLLASPAFGERWGRHWLDVARYGESTGSSRNLPYPHAWRYRDYVIAAFNDDLPYDEFIREQIAGDLLPEGSPEQRARRQVATGFLALGVKDVNQRFKVRFVMDNIDEQIDTIGRSVLALTASCARCHDHKFDPIPTADYYALAGILHSTDLCAGLRNKMGGGGLDFYDTQLLLRIGSETPGQATAAESQRKIDEMNQSIELARAEFEALRGKPEGDEPGPDGRPKRAIARQKLTRLQQELLVLTDPSANGGQIALGLRDSQTVGDTEIRIRGEAEKLGPKVPRGFLSAVRFSGQPQINPRQSGRLELAAWLVNEHNPLTPRVMANRIWQHLFGRGLVKSVDNFGTTGDRPSHPELLDYLAVRFAREGWSVKRLVRTLVLTRAYRLGTEDLAENVALDPSNALLWRHSPRRLDAEELRDTALAATGDLNLTRPPGSPAKDLKVTELRNNGPEARKISAEAAASRHRSLYLPLLRGLTPRPLEVFDFAEQGMVTGSRDTTTVATQALYLLNDPFVRRQALTLANQLLALGGYDDGERVNRAYRLTVGRPATSREIERALRYVNQYERAVADAPEADPPEDARLARVETGEETAGTSTNSGRKKTPKKKVPDNPDEMDQTDEPIHDERLSPANAKAAAWASFCQALLGSAEFRYLK